MQPQREPTRAYPGAHLTLSIEFCLRSHSPSSILAAKHSNAYTAKCKHRHCGNAYRLMLQVCALHEAILKQSPHLAIVYVGGASLSLKLFDLILKEVPMASYGQPRSMQRWLNVNMNPYIAEDPWGILGLQGLPTRECIHDKDRKMPTQRLRNLTPVSSNRHQY